MKRLLAGAAVILALAGSPAVAQELAPAEPTDAKVETIAVAGGKKAQAVTPDRPSPDIERQRRVRRALALVYLGLRGGCGADSCAAGGR